MPRLTSAASVNVLLWTMPRYTRPAPTPLVQAVSNADHPFPVFKRSTMTDADHDYLINHGMPNGGGFGIDYGDGKTKRHPGRL